MSRFLRIKCDCGNEMTVFGNASTEVHCQMCKKIIAEPRGARALVHGKIISVL